MANPNFLELEWKVRRALDIIGEQGTLKSSEAYRDSLTDSLERFKRVTKETDDIYRDWRTTRGERMRTFRELRRESDRIKDLCDEHALDDYPDQKIAYTEEEHLEALTDQALTYLEANIDEWDWISDRISNLKALRKTGDTLQAKADKIYQNYTVKVKERVSSYDRLLAVLGNYLDDASMDVSDHENWSKIQLTTR